MSLQNETTPRWYVIHTYSGYENKVASNIEKIVENRGLQNMIFDVRIPIETVVEKEKEIERKLFPSYVLIKMIMNDESWHVIRNTRGVTGFVGPGSKPVPLTDAEIEKFGVETRVIEISYKTGDSVRICEGPLSGFIAVVDEISPDLKKVKVTASMFGRETTVELESMQVKPLEN